MGFCRAPISPTLSTEERRESFTIHATYAWSPKESPDYIDPVTGAVTEFRGQHIEIAYEDLPGLIDDLQEIERDNYDACHPKPVPEPASYDI